MYEYNAKNILDKLNIQPFVPFPWLADGKAQTIASFYFPYDFLINNNAQAIIELNDGDKLVLIENTPKHWVDSHRIILLVHGLTGSATSQYLIRMTKRFIAAGYKVMRLNLRGCGLGKGLAEHLYHSGRSEDTRAVLDWLAKKYPNSPVTQIGFSLGGNITLKMAGEGENPRNVDSFVAVSPPLDLEASVRLMMESQNKVFHDYFVKLLIKDALELEKNGRKHLTQTEILGISTLYQFDDIYTAPQSGFKNAHDYYNRSSSGQFLKNITLPTLIIYAKDDPVVSQQKFLRFEENFDNNNFIEKNKNIDLLMTHHGGHMGWLGPTQQFGHFRWMDQVVVSWVKWFNNN